MLKLLLSQDRHALRREYVFRVLNVYFIIAIILCLIMGALLFIPHLFVKVQNTIVTNELANSKIVDGSKQRADFEKLGRHVQYEYKMFTAPILKPFDVMNHLTEVPSDGISLTAINILKVTAGENSEEVTLRMTLQGIARDRNALLTYSKSLESDDFFKDINIPPVNFTKDSDINFSLTMTTEPIPKNI